MTFEEWFEVKYGIAYDVSGDIFNKDVVKGLKLGWEAKEEFYKNAGFVEPVFKSYSELMLEKVVEEIMKRKESE